MKARRLTAFFFIILLTTVSISACSNDDEEKGSIEKFTDKSAHDAVNQIQVPIDKAKAVQALVNERLEDTRKAGE